MLNNMKQIATDEQECSMLTNLDQKLLADYFLIKEKGDDVKVYAEERNFVPNKGKIIKDKDQLVISKTFKISLTPNPQS